MELAKRQYKLTLYLLNWFQAQCDLTVKGYKYPLSTIWYVVGTHICYIWLLVLCHSITMVIKGHYRMKECVISVMIVTNTVTSNHVISPSCHNSCICI